MRTVLVTLTIFPALAGSAFGATGSGGFAFFGTLGLLIALNVFLGALLALGIAVILSHLRDQARRLQPVRVRTREAELRRRRSRR